MGFWNWFGLGIAFLFFVSVLIDAFKKKDRKCNRNSQHAYGRWGVSGDGTVQFRQCHRCGYLDVEELEGPERASIENNGKG
jgi:uncharacterized ferredoxin-like protein